MKYLYKKLFYTILTIIFVIIINYFLFRILPGDPLKMLIRNPKASPEMIKATKEMFGLDRTWYEQFFVYVKMLFQGDLGMSFMYKRSVVEIIGEKIFPTLLLVGTATVLSIIFGLLIGIATGKRRGSKLDASLLGFSLLAYSMPTFWIGVVLTLIFSVYIPVFPTTGMVTPGLAEGVSFDKVVDIAKHMFLPVVSLSLILFGQYVLIMRNALLETFSEDYIGTAKAKGFSQRYILRKHAIPNAMLPVITVISINVGFMLGGAIEIETVFSWPGLGRLMYDALMNRDFPLLQGIFLIISICVVFANFFTDLLYGILDPRVRG